MRIDNDLQSSRSAEKFFLKFTHLWISPADYRQVNNPQVLTQSLPAGNLSIMDKLLAYINGLSPDSREEFAADAKTSIGYLRKAISTKQKLGESLCMNIERASNRAVTCEDLRPDLSTQWAYLRGTKNQKKAA